MAAQDSMGQFVRLVNEAMAVRGITYAESWNAIRGENPNLYSAAFPRKELAAAGLALANSRERVSAIPAAQVAADKFSAEVKALCQRTGRSWEESWNSAKVMFPALANEMAVKPPGTELLADGTMVANGSRPSPEVLAKLGLPPLASAEQISIWKTAKRSEVTDETSCQIIVVLATALQTARGFAYSEAMKFIEENFKQLFQAAQRAITADKP